jgi:nicotinamidase-related amidase
MITALDKHTALILIDLQNGMVEMPLAHPVISVIKNAAKLVSAFHKAGLPVVIVNVNPSGAAWTTARKEPSTMPSRPFKENWTDIVPEIEIQSTDILITKTTWGAFYDTDLDEQLKAKGVTGIVLAGISTSIGVEGTAREASVLGYNVTFAKDAMTDLFVEAHENSLAYIFPRIGEIDVTDKIVKFV